MSRMDNFNFISTKLNELACLILSRGRQNLLDIHGHAENTYQHLLSEVYGWKLDDGNDTISQNVKAIDLLDNINNLIIQVSATATKRKIQNSLSKCDTKKYANYTFKFVSISPLPVANLKSHTYKVPEGIIFTPSNDIIDNVSILSKVKGMKIDDQKRICTLISKELSNGSNNENFIRNSDDSLFNIGVENAINRTQFQKITSVSKFTDFLKVEDSGESLDILNSINSFIEKIGKLEVNLRTLFSLIVRESFDSTSHVDALEVDLNELRDLISSEELNSKIKILMSPKYAFINYDEDTPEILKIYIDIPHDFNLIKELRDYCKENSVELDDILVRGDFSILN